MRIRLSRSLKLPVAEKRGRRTGRACETLACAYVCPGILGTQSRINEKEREREREREREKRGKAEKEERELSRLSLGERISLCVMKAETRILIVRARLVRCSAVLS